jgi:hypothetical protein
MSMEAPVTTLRTNSAPGVTCPTSRASSCQAERSSVAPSTSTSMSECDTERGGLPTSASTSRSSLCGYHTSS